MGKNLTALRLLTNRALAGYRIILLSACLVVVGKAVAQPVSLDSLEQKLDEFEGLTRAKALYQLVNGHMRANTALAKPFVEQVVEWSSSEDDPGLRSYLDLAMGVYCVRSGLVDSAITYFTLAKEHALAIGLGHALVRAQAELGTAYVFAGKGQIGIDHMLEGLRLIEEYPDREIEYRLYSNLVWAYLELKRYRDCIRQGVANVKMMENNGYDWVVLYTYNNVAVCYRSVGALDSAKYFIEKGIQAAIKNNDNQQLANGYFILGKIYADGGQPELAIAEYLKARPYREKAGNPMFFVADLYTIADLYATMGEYRKGLDAALEALAIAKKYQLQMKYDWTYLALARNYEGIGDFKNASRYYRLWAIAKDSLYQHANAQAIAEMETRYATEKKEQELALKTALLAQQSERLVRNNVIIAALTTTLALLAVIWLLLRSRFRRKRELVLREAQIHATIESQESERRRFAQDLHDGMGQLISALRLALHRIDRDTPIEERINIVSKAESLLNDMHREIRSIAFNLMPQTLVQSGLIPALKEMAGRINDSGRITVRVTSFDLPERLPTLYEISLYRIIQEWVNNVMKYATANLIEIQLVGFDDEITLTIEDDGKGFDIAVLQNSSGNGWKNIRSRVNLVRGQLEIDSYVGHKGTTLIVRVPSKPLGATSGVAVAPNTH